MFQFFNGLLYASSRIGYMYVARRMTTALSLLPPILRSNTHDVCLNDGGGPVLPHYRVQEEQNGPAELFDSNIIQGTSRM